MNRIDKLITIFQALKTHIVAITKSWLHDQINDAEMAIHDYHIFRKEREGRGGGALLFIKSSLRPKQQIQLKHDNTPGGPSFINNCNKQYYPECPGSLREQNY